MRQMVRNIQFGMLTGIIGLLWTGISWTGAYAQEEEPPEESGDQNIERGLEEIMNVLPSTMTDGTIATFVIQLVNWFLGILGIVFLIIVIYAGVKYMIAKSGQEAAEARTLITNAVIGLAIIFGSYLVTQYVAGALVS